MKTIYQKSTKTLRTEPENYCVTSLETFGRGGTFDAAIGCPDNFGGFLSHVLNITSHYIYTVEFKGRQSGALGITYNNKVKLYFVEAQPEDVLQAAITEDFEYIEDFKVIAVDYIDRESIHSKLKKLNIELSGHCSDIYCPVTPETTAIINNYEFKKNVKTFKSEIDGQPWYEIPLASEDYYKSRNASRVITNI